jgi:hypothetical protein
MNDNDGAVAAIIIAQWVTILLGSDPLADLVMARGNSARYRRN